MPYDRWVTSPFRVGDPAVWLEAVDQGMRVERTAVISVRPAGDGWTVTTLAGTDHVDERGEGRQLIPLEPETAAEFQDRNTSSFVVESTIADIARDRDETMDWARFEQELGREQDQGYEQDR